MHQVTARLRQLARFLNPEIQGGMRVGHWIAILLLALSAVLARDTGLTSRAGGIIGLGGYPYAPPATEFGLVDTCCVIHSAYMYEAGLVGYQVPVDDVDYMLNAQDWTVKGLEPSEPVRLPGHPWDHYQIVTWSTIAGSGIALQIMAPNGGRFALLHLLRVVNVRAGHWYAGGTYVGWSGWPTDPFYGNGTSGVSDAHLCLVNSQGSAAWFAYMDSPQDRPPKPKYRFPLARWDAYAAGHHWPASRYISPKWHGHWSWGATIWSQKRRYIWMRGAKNAGVWYGPIRGRRYGFTVQTWAHGHAYMWPAFHLYKVVRG